MDKKYIEFIDEISPDELYEGLLGHGFWPDKLPPIFTSIQFLNYCKTKSNSFNAEWSEYITFRVTRNIGIPRIMGIPNPFQYERMCAELRDDWQYLKLHFREQTENQNYRISRIHIRKERETGRIFEMNYKDWKVDGNPELDLLIHDKGLSRIMVKADISTCFPSIYTHSIPWALVGKDVAKQNIGRACWYNRIDEVCSVMKNGETHGLLIGPHASNLLSEIILVVVDKELYNKGYRYIRHIDDYECYLDSYDAAQTFLRDLESALNKFDLLLNHKKTQVISLPIGVDNDWKNILRDLPYVNVSEKVKYPQVNTYIDAALKLATNTGNMAILNYAIKKLKSLRLSTPAKILAAKRLMHMAVIYPYLLPLMEEYVFDPYQVDINTIKGFSDTIYREAMKVNDYTSLYYAIYFAIHFDFVLEVFDEDWSRAQDYVIESQDCLLLVITWLYFMKQNRGRRRATQLRRLNNLAKELKRSDMNRYWLFCYEALTFGNLSGEWQSMKHDDISFIKSDIRNCIFDI
ncbi:RNA-directed DNA polymerase [uncultured Veillonella sp.]|uniref:RNA-directed DNA polymerase n=1 Tax=uncultured Veillonella sp. TaxID=159268 RepID=UPI0028D10260|nr:RNA-directed DNA polymerase [uncultured Veillonella sp.]